MAGNSYEKVKVYVVDQEGQPIQGANVALTCYYENWGEYDIKITELSQTRADGVASVADGTGIESCALHQPISANVTYFEESITVSGTWRDGVNALTAIIPNLHDLKVTIQDQHGKPVDGVEIRATPAQGGQWQPFVGNTDEDGVLVFGQIPAGTGLLLYLTNGDETKSSVITMENTDTAFAASMHAYVLMMTMTDGGGLPLDGISVKLSSGEHSDTSKTDETGTVRFDRLKPGTYEYSMAYQSRGYSGEIVLDQDKAETVVVGASKAPRMVVANATNASAKWFRYIMGELDSLILQQKQKAPRIRLVFVPIGYNENESAEFKALAQASVDRFLEVSPLRECNEPSKEIETYFIDPSACNISGCSDICGEYNNLSDNCQFLIKNCSLGSSNPYSDSYNMVIGLCKNISCGDSCGGCAADIPSRSVVSNSAECGGTPAYRIVTHEMGHGFGLYHVKSVYDLNGCWDGEQVACYGPNKADCNESAEDISRMVMAYCPSMDDYGPAGYSYLRDSKLKNYTEVCK